MRVAVFFLCFCSLLLKGNTHMFPFLQYGQNGNGHVHHSCKHNHGYSNRTGQDYADVADNKPDWESEYVIDDDEEDEDDKNIAAEKYRKITASHATHAYPSYASILNYLCNSFKAAPSVCLPASDKYILQGVLRI